MALQATQHKKKQVQRKIFTQADKQTLFEAVSADNGNILKHNRKLAF